MENTELLKTLLVAQVLSLGQSIKAAKLAKGTQTTSDCVSEALTLIKHQRTQILSEISKIQSN